MENKKHKDCKKVLVRNVKQKVCKNKTENVACKNVQSSSQQKSTLNLGVPQLNTILKLADDIRQLETGTGSKISVKTSKNVILPNLDKMTKQMNFPHDTNIYKDLVPINPPPVIKPKQSNTYWACTNPKDIEPVLSDYFQPKALPEYSFDVPSTTRVKKQSLKENGARLYKLQQSWNE